MKTIWKIYADDNEGVSKPTQHGLQNSTPPPTMLCQQWDDEGPVAVVLSAFTQTHHLQNPTAISCFYNVWRIQSLKGEWSARPSENFNRIGLKFKNSNWITSILKTWYQPSLPIPHWSSSKQAASRSISWSTQSNTRNFQALKMIRKDPYCWWWSALILHYIVVLLFQHGCYDIFTCSTSLRFWNQMHIYPWSLSFAGDHSGVGWGGVGWGWGDNVPCACTHLWCSSIAEKAWDNVSADCFAVVQKWL